LRRESGSFLAEKRIDRGRDHERDVRVGPRGRERCPRCDVGVDAVQIGAQELPGSRAPLVRLVDTDVAAPHDPRAGAPHRVREAGRLRVVDHHHVARTHERQQFVGVAAKRRLVMAPLGLAQLAAVAGRAVEAVVDPLRDREKRRVAFDHEPARVDAGPADIGEQRLQHLGDPAAGCGRVDVQHCAPTERAARRLGHRLESPHALNPD
jgi:hypothetical protein